MSDAKMRLARRIRDAALKVAAGRERRPAFGNLKIAMKLQAEFRTVYISTHKERLFAFSWWFGPFGESHSLLCFKRGPWTDQILAAAARGPSSA